MRRLYNIARRGLACVAYPWKEAMRRPDCRDRRGGKNSHVFFVSNNLILKNAEFGSTEATKFVWKDEANAKSDEDGSGRNCPYDGWRQTGSNGISIIRYSNGKTKKIITK